MVPLNKKYACITKQQDKCNLNTLNIISTQMLILKTQHFFQVFYGIILREVFNCYTIHHTQQYNL